jgi:L-ascorbate metabolism protein UlaG (beta-lactamase superfamily)
VRQPAGVSTFPDHFDGRRFFNPNAPQVRGFWGLIRWTATSRPERSARFVGDVRPSNPPVRVDGNELRVTLVNHSTVLLQHAGGNILTDPIWSRRASPFPWAGPSRRREPGIRWEDLPPIDLLLLSHNHYDHLDVPTLRRLAKRGPTRAIVPLGLGPLVRSLKLGEVEELDWGESSELASGAVHSVPALHFSARGLFDRNRTLWCGYFLEIGGFTLYFAGDTAFGEHFAQIRERFGAPRAALLPIGAYEPRWFMSPVHMGPDQAVQAHEILGAQTSIAIHHGTFQLADEAIDTPKRLLRECAPDGSFLLLENGESVSFT